MQLTYEIANLQLLLEGSLSDRFVRRQRIVKRRTTVGFPGKYVRIDLEDPRLAAWLSRRKAGR